MDVLCDSQVLYPHFLQGLLVGSGGNMLQYAFTNHLSRSITHGKAIERY